MPAPTAARSGLPTIVFDFAGVLFHWQPLDLLQQLLPQHAVDEASARHWAALIFQGYNGDWADFDRCTVTPAALVQRIARRTGLAPADVQAVVDAVPLALQPLADSVALVQQLHAAGHRLFFLSNMPASYADHLERHNPFLQLFVDGVYSARVQQIKPESAIYALAARRFGVAPAGLLFFDDVPANVDAARAAGWQAAHFTGAAAATKLLQNLGFDLGR